MCGIVGYAGSFSSKLLSVANRRQSHRGPDDEGLFVDSEAQIGLGHVRLSIIDLSPLGHQPMFSEDDAAVIIFNGEIYNFKEIRANLETKGRHFRGNSDTEVLLQLYLEVGESMLEQLNGIFAFAIWDKRSHSLFIARDALGVKPLYYAETFRGVVFASEIKALVRLAPEVRELDEVALHRYLSFLWCPGTGTPLRAVRKLAPGEAMIVRHGKVKRRWQWYQLPVFGVVDEYANEGEAVRDAEKFLRQAVHRQLMADVPVGAFLSGGLDSSAVVAFARERNSDIRCFTIELNDTREEGMTDDLPYARKVAEFLDVPLEVIAVDAGSMAGDIEYMITQLDEPLADPAPLNVLYISRLARSQGRKVLLSGTGGDDLFAGYRRHLAITYEHYWSWLPRKFRSVLTSLTAQFDQRIPSLRRITKIFDGAGLPGDARLVNYFRWQKEVELLDLYSPELRIRLENVAAAEPLMEFLKPIPERTTSLERILALEQRFFLADHNLIYTDKMSMAEGVEVRVPFLDMDIVKYAARIPAKMKQRGFVGKWILKKVMEPYLPHEVIYRPKTGFGAPLRQWMRYDLKPLIHDLLSETTLRRRRLFNPAAVQRLIHRNETGRVDAAYILLSLLSIEIWCRTYIDKPLSEKSDCV